VKNVLRDTSGHLLVPLEGSVYLASAMDIRTFVIPFQAYVLIVSTTQLEIIVTNVR
jgi:hypothetical protein